MTIKTKLIANVLLTAVIIVAISLASFLRAEFVKEKISYLTEKSTPFQIRTVELQRELQACIAALVKVNAARSIADYTAARAAADKSLAAVARLQHSVDQMGRSGQNGADELSMLAGELFSAVEERLSSVTTAAAANEKVQHSMKLSSSRLADLDMSIRKLQLNYSRSFAAALEKTGTVSKKLRSIEDLRNMIRELQIIAVTVQVAKTNSAVLLAKAKLKAVDRRMTQNAYYTANKSIATVATGFTVKLDEYIKLQSAVLTRKDEDLIARAETYGKDLSYKLNDLFQTLDQEIMLAGDELSMANTRQGNIFNESNSANSILVANSELVALGVRVTGETNRLFTLESAAELDTLDGEIRSLFANIQELLMMMEKSLAGLQAREELQMLRSASATLTTIRTEIYATDGIVTKLKKKLHAIEQANGAAEKLNGMVVRQTVKGNESVVAARNEQNKAVSAVYEMISNSLSKIIAFSTVAIVIGILFGFWIYRSVLLPLRVVLGAVRVQEAQGQEKAHLAEAVANGDLNQEVTVSQVLQLDAKQLQKDEMGMVLQAVVGMSKAQTTLDRAFADMTESLRSGRDDEIRRDRLKSGLHELNKILRGEHDIQELADYTLAFMAAFLDAGVGILYLYNDREQLLLPLASYAISLSEQPDGGSFRLGEGLAGQAAAERKAIHLDTVPPGYLTISSALGEAEPRQVAILPIMHNSELVGVLELGSFKPFSSDDFEFLQQGLEGIAIAILTNRSRQLVNELLEQTQTQSEELRLQQEELQQTNEELEERARMFEERVKSA